jgi:hypothetical protein
MALNYQNMKIEDIIKWCKDNNEVAWLKAKAAETIECKVYPRKKVVNSNGKTVSVADKTQTPTIKTYPITFIQLKKDFVEKFMPEIAPKASGNKKPTMFDLIAEL